MAIHPRSCSTHTNPVAPDRFLVIEHGLRIFEKKLHEAAVQGGVDQEFIAAGNFELEVAGKRFAAVASLRPMYDPTGEKIKC